MKVSNEMEKISQMPVVLIPIHFDRSIIERSTSFQRSVVLRSVITFLVVLGTLYYQREITLSLYLYMYRR